ncbi:putative nuclease HARBI1 [Phlebotomus papatasi]|uniref:putative nuclease HARBI1 n=1 Tax=Phlebotomus papatasi TaxID=29031 RepID=UPI00248460FC|nr:putative nuclease HARBI1 [Phlebotomus papatasi]
MEKFNMPNVIGCVDCTHISIIRPLMHDTERPPRLYINRKKFYSLNVEATVDSDLIFTSVNPKFPGATHDSGIWMKSPVRNHMKKEFLRNREQHIVLGDKGYPLEPFIFTPYPTPETDNQERFNRLHEQARNTIERSFGVLKAVFRCLLKHRVLHYKPVIAGKITNACFTLYNYMRRNGYNFDQIEGVNEEFENDIALNDGELYRIGLERRETYISAL